MSAPYQRRRCIGCGNVGRRAGDWCHRCEKPSDDELTDGRWVLDPRRRVLVWQSTRPTVRMPDPPVSHSTERGWQWHRANLIDWPLPLDDPCGCRAAHFAHVHFVRTMNRRAAKEVAA